MPMHLLTLDVLASIGDSLGHFIKIDKDKIDRGIVVQTFVSK